MDNPLSSAGKRDHAVTVRRILKVNHAGEFGAIRIYGAQIWMAHRLFPEIVPALHEMRNDEIEHCRLFREAMPSRNARPCRVMAFWSLGGYLLGLLTALGGRNMVWICTEAVESAVHRHLEDQLAFLDVRDPELKTLIASIQQEELSHLTEAQGRRGAVGSAQHRAISVIGALTDALIWLSTWGDSTRMTREMQSAAS